MRKLISVLVVAAMCICLAVPAFATEGLDSLGALFEGVDVASLSDTELSALLEGLNLEGFDLDAIREAFGGSDSGSSDALTGLKDTLGAIGSGESGGVSGLTDALGSLTGGADGAASTDSPIAGITDAIDSIKGDDSEIMDSVTAGLSSLFGGMDMSWLSGVVSNPDSLLDMFNGGSGNGGSGFDFGAIMDMISGAFSGAGFDIGSLIGGADLGSFDIASVLGGAGDLGSLLGGGSTASSISDAVASISDMLKSGLEQLGLDPSIIDKLLDNDIVNFFANLFIGLGDMLGIDTSSASAPSTPSAPATPNTGDTAAVFVAFGTLCAASAAAFVCLKKKKA